MYLLHNVTSPQKVPWQYNSSLQPEQPKSSLIILLKAGSDTHAHSILCTFPFSYSQRQSSKCCSRSWKSLEVYIPLPELTMHPNDMWCTQRHQVVKQIPQSSLPENINTSIHCQHTDTLSESALLHYWKKISRFRVLYTTDFRKNWLPPRSFCCITLLETIRKVRTISSSRR